MAFVSSAKGNVLFVVVLLILVSISSVYLLTLSQRSPLKVFHAGSLSEIFLELEMDFEEQYGDVDVQRESAGSVETIRKVTDLGKKADVVASADYSLIQSMMMESTPSSAEFFVQFASNQIVIAYSDYSDYRTEIDDDNWYEILGKPDVRFGFSNPNLDPCGYRSLMVIQLAEIHYNERNIFEHLISDHSAIYATEEDGNYSIQAPEYLDTDDTITMRPKEVDLMGLLETGQLDYVFIYRSVAFQHRNSGIDYLELPEEVDLSAFEQKENYSRVNIVRNSNIPERASSTVASPIVYGVTIPSNAENKVLALEFIKLLLGNHGRSVIEEHGQVPITPPVASDIDSLPDELRPMVVKIEED
jgi:molybdate/tungstate transport system substrate-binding protein